MYIGIDLGTSNSSISLIENNNVTVIYTADNQPVLPSFIYFDSLGGQFIGKKAYEKIISEPQNVLSGFKRLMGTSSSIEIESLNRSFTAEEASCEILKALIRMLPISLDEITGTVVTVPAAFNQMQNEATLRAAKQAGLTRVSLLQEPIAASIAAADQDKSGLSLIFDLGGGTFDTALIQNVAGNLNVIDNLGVNMLGGRDFDYAILTHFVIPELHKQYRLPENLFSAPDYRHLIKILQLAIEQAKIQLSDNHETSIIASKDLINTRDLLGTPINVALKLEQGYFIQLIKSDIDKCISLCHKLMTQQGYTAKDVTSLVFIGGPSKMLWLREYVSKALGINYQVDVDPMTAVSQGAALFAESRVWEEGNSSFKKTRARYSLDNYGLKIDYLSRVNKASVKLRVSFHSEKTQLNPVAIQIESSQGWSSGKIDLEDKFEITLPLLDIGINNFRIILFDEGGQFLQIAQNMLSITRVNASISGIPAAHNLSVKTLSDENDVSYNALDVMISKGTMLPATGEKKFRAARDVDANTDQYIDLELYQQESPNDDIEDCLFIGSFRISGIDLLPGMKIYRGDIVVCQWTMSDSGILRVTIDIPSTGQTFDTGNFYVDSTGHINFNSESGIKTIESSLNKTNDILSHAKDVISDEQIKTLNELGEQTQQIRNNFHQNKEADHLRKTFEALRDLRQSINQLVNDPKNKKRKLTQQFNQSIKEYDHLITILSVDEVYKIQMKELKASFNHEIAQNTPMSLELTDRIIKKMRYLIAEIKLNSIEFLTYAINLEAQNEEDKIDKELHAQLIRNAELAVNFRDTEGLKMLYLQMLKNKIHTNENSANTNDLSGLMVF